MGEAVRSTLISTTGSEMDQCVWKPEGQPGAIVQLVHGMAEHIERYDATARRLNTAGILVVGHTQLGHGEKAPLLGYFADANGWDALVEDEHLLRLQTQKEYPGVPYFMLGHSMGSFVVRCYCLKHEAGLAGVILSGTGHFEAPILNFGLFLAKLQCALGWEKKPSKLLNNISFAGYNRDWTPPRTAFDWLSKDTGVVDRYIQDPFCGFPFTAAGYRDFFGGLMQMYPQNLSAMDRTVPVLLYSGANDPVGARGEGVKATRDELLKAGVKDVSMKLYEGGRHEMLNELERETVWEELITWIGEHRTKA